MNQGAHNGTKEGQVVAFFDARCVLRGGADNCASLDQTPPTDEICRW